MKSRVEAAGAQRKPVASGPGLCERSLPGCLGRPSEPPRLIRDGHSVAFTAISGRGL